MTCFFPFCSCESKSSCWGHLSRSLRFTNQHPAGSDCGHVDRAGLFHHSSEWLQILIFAFLLNKMQATLDLLLSLWLQGVLEFLYPDDRFHISHGDHEYDIFGHGGMLFWFSSSIFFTIVSSLSPIIHFSTVELCFTNTFWHSSGLLHHLHPALVWSAWPICSSKWVFSSDVFCLPYHLTFALWFQPNAPSTGIAVSWLCWISPKPLAADFFITMFITACGESYPLLTLFSSDLWPTWPLPFFHDQCGGHHLLRLLHLLCTFGLLHIPSRFLRVSSVTPYWCFSFVMETAPT